MNKYLLVKTGMHRVICCFISAIALCAGMICRADDYSINVGDFSKLKLVGKVNVTYTPSATEHGVVKFTCDKEVASKIMCQNTKNTLRIEVDVLTLPQGCKLPDLTVYSSNLEYAENSSDSTLTVTGIIPGSRFQGKLIGNGTMILNNIDTYRLDASISTGCGHMIINGKATKAKLTNVGTGPFEANGLSVEEATCWIIGTGPIDCHVLNTLKIYGAGSGTVYYTGSPAKIINRTLGVKVVNVK
ncbi:MAG: DUF2807 domain-containing protein [Muribaculaceae bacterium]|nr:DUF2807 domain-containing protein [Muribaculaceae bacterium]